MEPEEYQKNYELEDWHWWFLARQNMVRNLLPEFVNLRDDQRILDVGCGTGGMTKFMGQYGRVVGVDVSEIGLSFCQKRGLNDLFRASALGLPFADCSIDLVTAFDVVYHKGVEDDLEALKEFHRVCKENGLLLVTACAFDFLRGKHDVAVHGARRYTRGELVRKLERAGFEVKKATYANALLFPLVLASRLWERVRRSRERAKSDLGPVNRYLNMVLTWICKGETSLLKGADLPLGSSVVCLASKNKRDAGCPATSSSPGQIYGATDCS